MSDTLDTASARFLAVSTASQVFPGSMVVGEIWEYVCNVESFIAQGAAPTADNTGTTPSTLVPANVPYEVDAACGAKLAAIGTSAGKATLTRVRRL